MYIFCKELFAPCEWTWTLARLNLVCWWVNLMVLIRKCWSKWFSPVIYIVTFCVVFQWRSGTEIVFHYKTSTIFNYNTVFNYLSCIEHIYCSLFFIQWPWLLRQCYLTSMVFKWWFHTKQLIQLRHLCYLWCFSI